MPILAPFSNVPDSQDIYIYRGARFELPIDLAFSIADCTITAQLRRYRLGPLVLAFTVTVVTAADGTFRVSLTAEQTATLKCGEFPHHSASRYWWDVRVEGPSPSVEAVYVRQGEAFVCAQVTRP